MVVITKVDTFFFCSVYIFFSNFDFILKSGNIYMHDIEKCIFRGKIMNLIYSSEVSTIQPNYKSQKSINMPKI